MNIIIVDDNKDFREVLSIYIKEQLQYNIIAEACTGLEAVNISNINKAQIILMDLFMPEMNGLEATKQILIRNPSVKIIAVTLHREKAFMQSLIEAGFRACIFKDDVFELLHKAINEVSHNRYFFPDDMKIDI